MRFITATIIVCSLLVGLQYENFTKHSFVIKLERTYRIIRMTVRKIEKLAKLNDKLLTVRKEAICFA